MSDLPVLFVTGHAPPDRVAAFTQLHERTTVQFALFGGRSHHATADDAELPFPVLRPSQHEVGRLAASGRYRAVLCGTGGRIALPAAYMGARRARVPFVLWASLWAQPKSPAGIAGYPLLRAIYRGADAVVTYGPHVSDYVRARGARHVFEAAQAVDNEWWSAPADATAAGLPSTGTKFLFAGRMVREKGVPVLLDGWLRSAPDASETLMVLAGDGPERARADAARATVSTGHQNPLQLRNFYAASDVLVIPSIPTRTFREPWGLVANEAMNQGLPIIATDSVGAAAGGLIRHGQNGLVVASDDAQALSGAIVALRGDAGLRHRLGANGRADVQSYTATAWVDGILAALEQASRTEKGLRP